MIALIALALLVLAACAAPGHDAVVLWHAYQGDERAALEEVAARWNEAHPDAPLRLVSVPYDAFADKLTSAIPRGNGPDLFIFSHDRIGAWASSGLLEPLEYWVDDPLADRFAPDAIAAMAYGRSLYGLPLATKSLALFWRTDLLAAPPRTTDELEALAPAQRARGGYALAYANTELYGHAPWLHGFGGHVLTDDGELDVATPEATAALGFARRLVTEGATPPATTVTMVATLFNEGKAATALSGPWFLGDIAPGVPWAVTAMPAVSATGRPAAPFLGAEGILMSARARDKDAAFAVMNALADDASAIVRARRARQVVPNLAAYREPDLGGDPVLATFRDQVAATVTMPASPTMRMVWTPYQTALQNVIGGGADPGDALLAVQREVTSYLRDDAGSKRR